MTDYQELKLTDRYVGTLLENVPPTGSLTYRRLLFEKRLERASGWIDPTWKRRAGGGVDRPPNAEQLLMAASARAIPA